MQSEMNSKDIVAVMMDDVHMRIIAPSERDSENVKHIKMFMLACFARRNLDDSFDAEMRAWLNSITEEQFLSHNNVSPVRVN